MAVKSYKYRFYPTPEQEQILSRTFGCVRYVYNRALQFRSETYGRSGRRLSWVDLSRELTRWKREEETVWLKEASSTPLQQALRSLEAACRNFFANRSKYPSFKRKNGKQSAEYTRNAFKWDGANKSLTISKLGRLNIRWSRSFEAKPSTVTLSVTPTGKYFVSIRIEEKNREVPTSTREVGIDMGVKHLATLSTGEHITNPGFTNRYAKQLARAQSILSRRKKGSNRREKARLRVAKIQEKIANARLDHTHKTTTRIVSENQAVYIEDLEVSSMSRSAKGTVEKHGKDLSAKRGLNKAILDCGWFEFRRQLEYKCDWYGRKLVVVDPRNTSRTCSSCGHCDKRNRTSQSLFKCLACGHEANADVNAAKNILAAGHAVTGRGESVRQAADASVACNSQQSVNQNKLKPPHWL